MKKYTVEVKSDSAKEYEKFDAAFNHIVAQINTFQLIEKHTDRIYNILNNLVDNCNQFIIGILDTQIDEKCMKVVKSKIETLKNHVSKKVGEVKSETKN